jgi:hypothetical protein
METFVYCYPQALDTAGGREEVDDALAKLACELGFHPKARLREEGSNSIRVPNTSPEDLWRAMDRANPDWTISGLFVAPLTML